MSKIAVLALGMAAFAYGQGAGRPASPEEVRSRDITVFPNGVGLPAGSGNAVKGVKIYELRCALCHNKRGEGKAGEYPALAGGQGTLSTPKPKKTVGSYWPYATTLWDHIHRAMPFDRPRTLPANDVYSLTAYVLFLNGIIGEAEEMNERTLPAVRMPNRDGFVPDPRPDVKSRR